VVEAEWRLWAERKQCCDATGVCNFDELQQLALMSALMSGDCFALLPRVATTPVSPYSLRVKLVEADLVSTPDTAGAMPGAITEAEAQNGNYIYDGVEVSRETSAITAYYFCNRYPFELTHIGKPREWTRVEAYGKLTGLPNVLHIMEPERAGQYRGVTFLAPVIEQLLQIRRYTESELMAALVQSFFTAWIETESDPAAFPTNEVGSDEPEVSHDPNEYEMGAGQVIHLKPGEKVNFGNPNIPTNGFDAFVKSVATQIGAALEIPRDVLLKEFNSSYSASRGALLEAYRAFKKRRQWLVNDFCQPLYEIWLAEAVARGRISAPGFFADPLIRAAYCGTQWIGPAQSQIDPSKEVKAAILAVDRGFKTHEQATVEMDGGDWEENVEQLKREKAALAEAGVGQTVTPNDPDIPSEGENNEEGAEQ
jgi:lambda family phage portal protein